MVAAFTLAFTLLLVFETGSAFAQANNESLALQSLRDASNNWDTATASVPGAPWIDGTRPCGSAGAGGGGAGAAAWQGVTCSPDGQVAELALTGLGLSGSLPDQLASLPGLTLLNLSGNAFRGELPAAWSSASLAAIDLSSNRLSGALPLAWGGGQLPALATLRLQGNNLTGDVPMPEWTASAFALPAAMGPRPGNPGLCGAIMPLDSQLFPPGTPAAAAKVSSANKLRTGSNTSTLVMFEKDLFLPGTSVTLTNWLGSCMRVCDAVPPEVELLGLSWPPAIQTNIFDVGWVFNMSMSDLVLLNPDASSSRPGDALTVPCYPADMPHQHFGYYGGDLAYGQFAGGNQLAGPEGLSGAMAAARVVGYPPNEHYLEEGPYYVGSRAPGGQALVEPIYWFVDMLAPFQISIVLLTAGDAMRNASIYTGSDRTSLLGNTLVASGLDLAAGEQLAVATKGAVGRYIIVYTGALSEGTMSLRCVEVFTYESNAAPNMPVTASYLNEINRGGAGKILEVLVDNNASTCVQLKPDSSYTPSANSTAWAFVDLGYYGAIGSVAVLAGPAMSPGTRFRVYVTQTADESPSEADSCSREGRLLEPGAWEVGSCNQTGRFVTLSVTTTGPEDLVDLCELQVWLTQKPAESGGGRGVDGGGGSAVNSGGSGLSGSAIAGIVLGSLLGAVLLLLLLLYVRWRHAWLLHQRQVAALTGKEAQWADGQSPGDMEKGGANGKQQQAAAAPGRATPNGSAGAATVPVAAGMSGVAAAAARSSSGGYGGRISQVGVRVSEWKLLKEFAKSLRGANDSSLSNKSRQESMAYGPSIFAIAKPATGVDPDEACTDFTKLPSAFNEVPPSDIQLIELVGEGSFGEVWLAMYCGAFVAVKILAKVRSDNMTSSMQQQIAVRNLKKEALLMSKLRHPNVCLYLGACMDPPCLLFEYCAKSSLDTLLSGGLENMQMAKRLNWVRLLSMALDAAKGMLYLHTRSPPIAHRDFKSANLLVDSQWRVKVADFSLSRAIEMGNKMAMMTVMTTNPRWLPPEVLGGLPGHLPADVWAFGTVLWELCTWHLPYEEFNTFQIIAMVQHQGAAGLPVPPPEELPAGPFFMYQEYVALMSACLDSNPDARPKFDEIVQQLGAMLTAEVREQQAAAAAAGAHSVHSTRSADSGLQARAASSSNGSPP